MMAAAGLAAAQAAASPQEPREAGDRADGIVLSQARHCGYAHSQRVRLAQYSQHRARRAAEHVGDTFDPMTHMMQVVAGAKFNDELLAMVDPSSAERECKHVRREVDALLAQAPPLADRAAETTDPGIQVVQADACGYTRGEQARLLAQRQRQARRAAALAGRTFDPAAHEAQVLASAKAHSLLLAMAGPPADERDCAELRRWIDAALQGTPDRARPASGDPAA